MSTSTTQNRLLAAAYQNPIVPAEGPKTNPGELSSWPMLRIAYRTDKDRIAALLPPGLEPADAPLVFVTFYNVPIQNAPEYGIVVNVAADKRGTAVEYTLGIGINQETVIFPSKERWGQPKFHADTQYWRLGDVVEARTTHYGHTFAEFTGRVVGAQAPLPDAEQREVWVKYMRDCDLTPGRYDFPPHYVDVYSKYGTAHLEKLEGELVLRESRWDPIALLLPKREQVSAHLWTPTFLDRRITLGEPIDPVKFWPFADTIGGSRWPGENGAPPA
ncbi:MAG TPA: acetoacetate decarboxylase family protein [Myxococcota bacterium]|nr:acetoacetate decarboxylase family protein [Myxococcales bacterium]HPG26788.1 acetoacetate decarboxylase family protein [Myxococcota bacterium]